MKRNILFPLSLVAILLLGCTTPQKDSLTEKTVLETTDLHPEKYTLRLVRATGVGPMFEPSTQMLERLGSNESSSQITVYTEGWRSSSIANGNSASPESRRLDLYWAR